MKSLDKPRLTSTYLPCHCGTSLTVPDLAVPAPVNPGMPFLAGRASDIRTTPYHALQDPNLPHQPCYRRALPNPGEPITYPACLVRDPLNPGETCHDVPAVKCQPSREPPCRAGHAPTMTNRTTPCHTGLTGRTSPSPDHTVPSHTGPAVTYPPGLNMPAVTCRRT